MARTISPLFQGARGKVGDFLVIKQRGKKAFFSLYPSNTGKDRRLSPKQMAWAELMEEAAWYASGTRKDPALRDAALRRLDVSSKQLYHALVKEYIAIHRAEKMANPEVRTRTWQKRQFSKKKYKY